MPDRDQHRFLDGRQSTPWSIPFKDQAPVETSILSNEARSGGDWSTTFAPVKMNLVPLGIEA
jgi:hypothetical protein